MDTSSPEPAQSYLQLRDRILRLEPAELGLTPTTTAPHVWGVLMETGYAVGIATLVSLADGTTSLYFSTGGGMLGSGDYAPVAEASKALVVQAENHLSQMASATEFPLPAVGQVRFSCFTYSGIFSAEAAEVTLKSGDHPLSPLFVLAHETLDQLRLSAEKMRR
jgi:hypothetical protein